MSEEKFTRGPWDIGNSEFTIYAGAKLVAHAHWGHGVNGEVARANAHLIAAAPDLYEALAETERYFSDADGLDEDEYDYRHRVRSALAKARGEV